MNELLPKLELKVAFKQMTMEQTLSNLFKVSLADEVTGFPDLVSLLKFLHRGFCPCSDVHQALNRRFRAATEGVSHCWGGNTG